MGQTGRLEVGIPGFFSYLPERLTNFRRFATMIMAMFGSTYVCEEMFSFMKSTKTCQRTMRDDEHLSSLKCRNCASISARHTKNCHEKTGIKPQDKMCNKC